MAQEVSSPQMDDSSIQPVYVRYKFSTVIKLPAGERIHDVVSGGDPRAWSFAGHPGSRICYLVPLRKKSKAWPGTTDLRLISTSGHIYSFKLIEISEGNYDATVFVRQIDPPKPVATVPACDPALKHEVELEKQLAASQQSSFKAQLQTLNNEMQGKTDPSAFVAQMRTEHVPRKMRRDPFNVTSIVTSRGFTFIHSKSDDQAAFYELDGKKPRLVNFSYADGVYSIPGNVHVGCLKIDKKKACFKGKD